MRKGVIIRMKKRSENAELPKSQKKARKENNLTMQYELRYKPNNLSRTGLKIKCSTHSTEVEKINLALVEIQNIFPNKIPNDMNATINQAAYTVDIESAVFPLNDFWTRSQQAINEIKQMRTEMNEKIGGIVELTVAPFIVNVVSQILLLIIDKQSKPSCSTLYFNDNRHQQKLIQLSKQLKMNKNTLCHDANALVDTRNNILHYQTVNQLEKDVKACQRYFGIYRQELNSLVGNLETEIISNFDKIRSLVIVAFDK